MTTTMPDPASLGSDESEREKRIFDQMHMKRHGALLSAAKDPDIGPRPWLQTGKTGWLLLQTNRTNASKLK
jgi:hypothetical protein